MPARADWRALLVHVQPEQEADPRLLAAADLATQLDAMLIGFAAETIPTMAASDPTGMMVAVILDTIAANLAAASARFKRETSGLRTNWVEAQAPPVPAACRLARGVDLIVAGGSPLDHGDKCRWCDPAELALKSGRPVLVVPPSGGRLEAQRIVVGWKDTREARRAIADSLPLLKCTDQVVVLEVCRSDEVEDARIRTGAVAEHLQRHGVDARGKVVIGGPDGAAENLQSEAAALGADVIVTGAYGHSRVGEWVFGGVTSGLLQDLQRFLLMSH